MVKHKKTGRQKPKRCKFCGRKARTDKECCSRHAWLEIWGVRWFVRLKERDPVLFKVLAYGIPIGITLTFAIYGIVRSLSSDDVSSAVEKTMRDNPEWFEEPLRDIIDKYGISVPQTGVLPRRGPDASVEELKRLYPDIGTSVLIKADSAKAALSAQDHELAERLCRELVGILPTVSGFHFDLALALMGQLKFAEASVELQKFVTFAPNDAIGRTNLGFTLLQLGQDTASIRETRSAILLDPDIHVNHLNLSFALSNIGEIDSAKEALVPLLNASESLPASLFAMTKMSLGRLYYEQDSLALAVTCFLDAIDLDSTNAFLYYNLGATYARHNDFPRCIAAFRQAVRLKPEMTHWRYMLAQAYYDNGDFQRANIEMQIAVQRDPGYFVERFFPKDTAL